MSFLIPGINADKRMNYKQIGKLYKWYRRVIYPKRIQLGVSLALLTVIIIHISVQEHEEYDLPLTEKEKPAIQLISLGVVRQIKRPTSKPPQPIFEYKEPLNVLDNIFVKWAKNPWTDLSTPKPKKKPEIFQTGDVSGKGHCLVSLVRKKIIRNSTF